MSKKRTIDAFFGASEPKKLRGEAIPIAADASYSTHPAYPFPIPHLPTSISRELASAPAPGAGRAISDRADLDLLYFEPYAARSTAAELFRFLRAELPFYRVEYDIQRGGVPTRIRTPRWTTVFGIDATSRFARFDDGNEVNQEPGNQEGNQEGNQKGDGGKNDNVVRIVDARTGARVPGIGAPDSKDGNGRYYAKHRPRPIPKCLDDLRRSAEAATGCDFNFCLVNYYASGADSIAFHSDDERFLGPMPAIASFSLGARRDFLMKHKPVLAAGYGNENGNGNRNGHGVGRKEEEKDEKEEEGPGQQKKEEENVAKSLKLSLGSGDMILMRGSTQANWLHSIPKRSGKNEHDGGRINITFRKAMVKGGTENYYNYNVGAGPVYRWDPVNREMKQWKP